MLAVVKVRVPAWLDCLASSNAYSLTTTIISFHLDSLLGLGIWLGLGLGLGLGLEVRASVTDSVFSLFFWLVFPGPTPTDEA